MLDLPEIAELSYEDAMTQYINRIKLRNTDWRYCGESSTGMVLLELFTYLTNVQRQNMNKVSEASVEAMAKLFSLSREDLLPSRSYVSFRGEGFVGKGERLLVGSMVFETKEDCTLSGNECVAIGTITDGALSLRETSLRSGEERIAFENTADFVIGLKKAVPTGIEQSLMLVLKEDERTPIRDRSAFLGKAETKWFYYGVEHGVEGWHEATLLSDSGHGFLLSGIVRFQIEGEMTKKQGCFLLRCTLTKDYLDRRPFVQAIKLDFVPIEQTDTKCQTIDFSYEEFRNNKMYFRSGLRDGADHILFVKEAQGYRLAEECGIYSELITEGHNRRLVTTDHEKILALSDACKKDDTVLRLCIYQYPYVKELLSFVGNGTAKQRFSTNFSGILKEGFSVMVAQKQGEGRLFREWHRTEEPELCDALEECFFLDQATGELCFGDNEHGGVPKSCTGEQSILVTGMKLSVGAAGNLPADREMKLLSDEAFAVEHFVPSRFGKNRESIVGLMQRMMESTKSRVLLTEEDFRTAALTTEGLILNEVAVTEQRNEAGRVLENAVSVIVEPKYTPPNRDLSSLGWYLECIRERLEVRKLLTTAVEVVFVRYIPCSVSLVIVPKSTRTDCEAKLREVIEQYFKERCRIGTVLQISDLYRVLDSLEYVSKITYLNIAMNSGEHYGLESGMQSMPPDGKLYLEELSLRIEEWQH